MNKKELKKLAQKIAKAENELDLCENAKQRKEIEQIIFDLSSKVTDLNDMVLLDELIQDILQNNTH